MNNYSTFRITAIESQGKPTYFAHIQRDIHNDEHGTDMAAKIAALMLKEGYVGCVEVKITSLHKRIKP